MVGVCAGEVVGDGPESAEGQPKKNNGLDTDDLSSRFGGGDKGGDVAGVSVLPLPPGVTTIRLRVTSDV